MGLCNTKPEAEDGVDKNKSNIMENSKAKMNSSFSILELQFKQTKDYYENILQTQEDEDNPEELDAQSAKSLDSGKSFPEKSLLSHSTSEDFDIVNKSPESTMKRTNILRACSDTSFKSHLKRKSFGEAQLTLDMRIDAVRGGNSL